VNTDKRIEGINSEFEPKATTTPDQPQTRVIRPFGAFHPNSYPPFVYQMSRIGCIGAIMFNSARRCDRREEFYARYDGADAGDSPREISADSFINI
jgi:hypothetical protein